ncbi:opcA protein [Scardovia wiggsiae F0424]|uniref:OpcA protein n=1 Tax=Scardovia wiggsiae F0424 TaxID=857290 RepID=J0D4H9_9BIFI|nr:glucose-6-phosphate dehydrogenase assembly protein OpcA [Scardovia wiggsiae]EJD64880.1 opcA protein [Scardovia wiggsiae F0424]
MKARLNNCTTAQITAKIKDLHEERGESTEGRVFTMLIHTSEDDLEDALAAANVASREHPCRIIAIATCSGKGSDPDTPLNAEIRFGADAGAGEIIVLFPTGGLLRHLDTLVIPLLVPDAPVLAWWPEEVPGNPSEDQIGRMARKRITDAQQTEDPERTFENLRAHWTKNDTDLSWTRLTIWRGQLAALIDQPPHTAIQSVTVRGARHYLPLELLAAWLAWSLKVPVTVDRQDDAASVTSVEITRENGVASIQRTGIDELQVQEPGRNPQKISVPHRTLTDSINEEMRRLDPDAIYAAVIRDGWDLVPHE